jgi:BolA family transcriptional regulator, general stress-responsive regulator
MDSEIIRQHLQDSLQAIHLVIEDDSHHHAGHVGAQGGGHYNVYIVSPLFNGKTTLQRHRMVYEVVNDLLNQGIHALSIKAHTPEEYHVLHS